jgi:FixJ family two-component response regulator
MQPTAALIAVVDDDAATRQSIERLLEARGYRVSKFESAEEFLSSPLIDSTRGLVLDIYLNGMSGFELRRHLSAVQLRIPVVFITAHDDDATRNEALAVGCIDCLQKPFASERLLEALERGTKA